VIAMPGESFELSTTIGATAMQVLYAFLEPQAIKTWLGARNTVVQPRPGGLLAVEWETGANDDVLGPSGGVLVGVLDRAMAGHLVHFGSLHWLTPRGETFGPTRLEVDVHSKNDPRRKPTLLVLRRTGFQSGPSWERYFDVERRAWERALAALRTYCETQVPQEVESHVMPLGSTYLAEAVLKGRPIS
jgi:hypothetical protein